MAEKNGIYKCALCGNIVSVIDPHGGALVCCGQEMSLMEEKRNDLGTEKHTPVIRRENNKIIVEAGKILHPMEDAHFIEFIQLFDGVKAVASKRLYPHENPSAEFCIKAEKPRARALCNVHGLWTS